MIFAGSLTDVLKTTVKALSNAHFPSGKPDIYLFTTARSGSTLLYEMLLTQDGMKGCDEPLDIRRAPIRRALGVRDWQDIMPGPGRDERVLAHFRRIRRNRVPALNMSPLFAQHRWVTNRLVFKVLHGCEDMLHEVQERLGGAVVHLIRHPLAVSFSREVFPRLGLFLDNPAFARRLNAQQRSFAACVLREGSHAEKGMLSWCLENLHPLTDPRRDAWLTLSYEELVVHPGACVAALAARLALAHPERMLGRVRLASDTTRKSDAATRAFFAQPESARDPAWLLGKWRSKLQPGEEARCFQIMRHFGIDAYEEGRDLPSTSHLLLKGA